MHGYSGKRQGVYGRNTGGLERGTLPNLSQFHRSCPIEVRRQVVTNGVTSWRVAAGDWAGPLTVALTEKEQEERSEWSTDDHPMQA